VGRFIHPYGGQGARIDAASPAASRHGLERPAGRYAGRGALFEAA
jgi:hypothetical protein